MSNLSSFFSFLSSGFFFSFFGVWMYFLTISIIINSFAIFEEKLKREEYKLQLKNMPTVTIAAVTTSIAILAFGLLCIALSWNYPILESKAFIFIFLTLLYGTGLFSLIVGLVNIKIFYTILQKRKFLVSRSLLASIVIFSPFFIFLNSYIYVASGMFLVYCIFQTLVVVLLGINTILILRKKNLNEEDIASLKNFLLVESALFLLSIFFIFLRAAVFSLFPSIITVYLFIAIMNLTIYYKILQYSKKIFFLLSFLSFTVLAVIVSTAVLYMASPLGYPNSKYQTNYPPESSKDVVLTVTSSVDNLETVQYQNDRLDSFVLPNGVLHKINYTFHAFSPSEKKLVVLVYENEELENGKEALYVRYHDSEKVIKLVELPIEKTFYKRDEIPANVKGTEMEAFYGRKISIKWLSETSLEVWSYNKKTNEGAKEIFSL